MDLDPIDYLYSVRGGIGHLILMRKAIKNWYMVALFYLGIVHSFGLRPRDGKEGEVVQIRDFADYKKFWEARSIASIRKKVRVGKNLIGFRYGQKTLKFYYDDEAQLADTLLLIDEQFFGNGYKKLDAKGSIVVDVGANIGDTAIYFALNGAKHVYAFEPYPYPYGIAKRNIKENGMNDRITLINAGCGASDSYMSVDSGLKSKSYTQLSGSNAGNRVRMLSLDTVAKRYCNSKAIMKIDCEGGEYDIILNASNVTLRKFKQIMIEYHDGYKNLEKKLRSAGFDVRDTRPLTISYGYRLFGMMFATRIGND